jgi:hypothetical protein
MPISVDKDGTITGFICNRGGRNHPCHVCRKRIAHLLCDYPVQLRGRKSATCDKHLHGDCAVHVGKDKDYCPDHPPEEMDR